MALPKKIKNLNLFVDGQTYIGDIESMTLPKLSRKMEAHRAGGMSGAAKIDMGLDDDALKAEWSIAGYPLQVLRQMGLSKVGGVQLRFVGALQRDDSGAVDSIEVVMSGRHAEVDRGEAKVGEKGSTKITTECVYYKESLNGVVVTEIDILNMIEIVDGVDRLKEQRRALGM